MTLDIFLLGLFIVSTFTGLFTEGIKQWLKAMNKTYHTNLLAGYVAIVLSILVSAGYLVLTETMLNAQMFVYLIALVLLSWLAAMIGHDKIVQAISQFKK